MKDGAGVICLLEFKCMSDVTRHYIVQTKRVAESQYASLKSTLVITMQRQGWKVEQVSFIVRARSLNEEEIKKNLTYFEVRPDHGVTSTRPTNGSVTGVWNRRKLVRIRRTTLYNFLTLLYPTFEVSVRQITDTISSSTHSHYVRCLPNKD